MSKKIYIFDWQYWIIIILLEVLLLTIPYLINDDSFFSLAISRFGASLGFAISFFQDNLKNKIKKITINDNTISFDIVKNFKKNIVNFNRNDLIACKMFIYTTYGIRICLHFEVNTDGKREFVDIYYELATLSIIKQLFNLQKYIQNFSYDVSSTNKNNNIDYVKSFIEKGFRRTLKNKVYDTIVTIALIVGFGIVFFAFLTTFTSS